jgi:hypothetical protein
VLCDSYIKRLESHQYAAALLTLEEEYMVTANESVSAEANRIIILIYGAISQINTALARGAKQGTTCLKRVTLKWIE